MRDPVLHFTGQKIKNFSHVYRRLHRNEASITLVPGHNAFPIHPWLNRLITVREAARIQTFPDELEFLGSSKGELIPVNSLITPLRANFKVLLHLFVHIFLMAFLRILQYILHLH